MSDGTIVVFFFVCVAVGFFMQPAAARWAKSVAAIRFRRTPTHLVISRTGRVQCVDCYQWLADSLKLFEEHDYEPLCFHCIRKRSMIDSGPGR